MKLAVGQLDPKVGDLGGNRRLVLSAIRRAKRAGAELLVLPELVLLGYPPGPAAAAGVPDGRPGGIQAGG